MASPKVTPGGGKYCREQTRNVPHNGPEDTPTQQRRQPTGPYTESDLDETHQQKVSIEKRVEDR